MGSPARRMRIAGTSCCNPAGCGWASGVEHSAAHQKERALAGSRHRRRRLSRERAVRASARRRASRHGARRAPSRRAVAAPPVREPRLRVRARRRARRARCSAGCVAEADAIIPLAAVVGAPACDRDPWLATLGQPRRGPAAARGCARRAQLVVYPDHQQRLRHAVRRRLLHRGDAARADLALRPHQGRGRSRRCSAQPERDHAAAGDRVRHVAAHAARPAGQPLRLRRRDRRLPRDLREGLQAQLHPHPRRRRLLPALPRERASA